MRVSSLGNETEGGTVTKTIVVVMMENRSFDHLLGWMSLPPYGNSTSIDGLHGSVDGPAKAITNARYTNEARDQEWQPFMLDNDVRCTVDLPHSRDGIQTQLNPNANGFGMDGFAADYFHENGTKPAGTVPENLAMYPPNLIPATSFLARAFMVCDRWFCAIPTDTHPNRIMSLAGYTKIDHTHSKPVNHEHILLDWCDARNIGWRVYSDGFSFINALRPGGLFTNNHRFRNTADLATDVQTERDETFPQLIIVEPEYADDPLCTHPSDNHPPSPMGPGERFLADTYRSVTSNPERWKDTIMIVVYDEHGGYFDHVPPFKVTTKPPPDNQWLDKTPFTTSGPRVPAIIVSPLVKPGTSTNKRFDHTAILQLMADAFDDGRPYSAEVAARHAEGQIERIWDVLAPAPVQAKAPTMPNIEVYNAVTYSAAREPTTDGMRLFASARQMAMASDPASLAAHNPASFRHVRVPANKVPAFQALAAPIKPPSAVKKSGMRSTTKLTAKKAAKPATRPRTR